MGMDVSGKNPTSKAGKYFRANVWRWLPIWHFCESIAPDLCAKVEHAGTNDGDGLGARDAAALGRKVTACVEDGSAAAYLAALNARLDAMPRERCTICHGTGKRTDAVADANPHLKERCNGCEGTGSKEHFESWYRFTLEHLAEFGVFLSACGGFEIW